MGMRFSLDLSDRDLRFFREALARARHAVRDAEESEIIEAIGDVLSEIKGEGPLPDFVSRRIPQLESMIRMLQDEEWRLPAEERERLLATFIYFGDPEDILPDHIPVVGYLDDVIMIELVVRELRHVRDAYDDFCDFRENYDKSNKSRIDSAVRRDRIDRKRQQLHQRMKRRLKTDKNRKKSPVLW
ncbi:MAG: YkvA family protein [Gammaproteobacteria bacterium]|nr:YkvA family protein [Gammaproteobacteria bacterium]MDH4315442.1 YkvA family protein [Gammaproteobacteria bacterium]MDH5215597.1 YkvA family protein [Gammaproteobacteria bacterium]